MKSNYRTVDKCCGRCQFVMESSPMALHRYIECGHPENAYYNRTKKHYERPEVTECGICDLYKKPGSITEEDYKKLFNKRFRSSKLFEELV